MGTKNEGVSLGRTRKQNPADRPGERSMLLLRAEDGRPANRNNDSPPPHSRCNVLTRVGRRSAGDPRTSTGNATPFEDQPLARAQATLWNGPSVDKHINQCIGGCRWTRPIIAKQLPFGNGAMFQLPFHQAKISQGGAFPQSTLMELKACLCHTHPIGRLRIGKEPLPNRCAQPAMPYRNRQPQPPARKTTKSRNMTSPSSAQPAALSLLVRGGWRKTLPGTLVGVIRPTGPIKGGLHRHWRPQTFLPQRLNPDHP